MDTYLEAKDNQLIIRVIGVSGSKAKVLDFKSKLEVQALFDSILKTAEWCDKQVRLFDKGAAQVIDFDYIARSATTVAYAFG